MEKRRGDSKGSNMQIPMARDKRGQHSEDGQWAENWLFAQPFLNDHI